MIVATNTDPTLASRASGVSPKADDAGGLSYAELFAALLEKAGEAADSGSLSGSGETADASGAPLPVPDLSNEAWLRDTQGTRAALDEYARSVLEGSGSVADKYRTLRETLPAELFADTNSGWLNRVLPGNNASAAEDLIHAIDPYSRDTWIDQESGSRMNSLAAGAFPDAVRVGYDATGSYYDLTSTQGVAPGEYRDLSDAEAMRIILGETGEADATAADSGAGVAAAEAPADADAVQGVRSAEGAGAYLANAERLLQGLERLSDLIDEFT